jgi:hypothetical protein
VIHGDEEFALGAAMAKTWHALAATGVPPAELNWRQYTNTTREWLVWDTPSAGGTRIVRALHKEQCDWWDKYISLAPTG